MASLYKLAIELTLQGAGAIQSGLSSIASTGLGAIGIGAGAAGTAIVGVGALAFDTASDINAASNQMAAALGLPTASAEAYEDVMQDMFDRDFGAGFDDIAASLVTVDQNMSAAGISGTENMQAIAEGALTLRDVFEVDVAESASAVTTLMEEFGLTADEALTFVTAGFQQGLDSSGDFLDSIGEYSTQFSEGGATADQFFSTLQTGMQGGMLGTDKAADLFKEFRVRIQDGSDATIAGLEAIGINADDLWARMGSGETTAAEAFDEVQAAMAGVTDENVRMVAGVQLMGTQFEDLGQDAVAAVSMSSVSLEDLAGATDSLGVKYNDLNAVQSSLWRDAQLALAPFGEMLLGLANQAMPFVQQGFAAAMPYLQAFALWLGANIPVAIQAVGTYWTTTLQPALLALWGYLQTNVLPIVQEVVTFIGTNLPGAMAAVSNFWTTTLQPALTTLWDFVSTSLLPVITDLAEIGFHGVRLAVIGLMAYWEETLMPALEAAWKFLSEDMLPVWQFLGSIIQAVAGWINDFSTALANMSAPPEWLIQMMGGGTTTAANVTAAAGGDNKGGGMATKAAVRGTTRGAMAFAGSGGMPSLTQIFYGPVNDAEALRIATESGTRRVARSRGTTF